MKRITVIALAALIVIGSCFYNRHIFAQPVNDLDRIQDRRAHIKNDLSQAENKMTNLASEIEDLNKAIAERHQALEEKQKRISQIETDIAKTIQDMESLQAKI